LEGKRGLIDTSVAVALGDLDASRFPEKITISTLTLAELATGPSVAEDDLQRAARQGHLQYVEGHFKALPFDSDCARAYGRVYAAVVSIGRKARGACAVDLMIAATALAHGLPLYTLNADDLRGLEGLVEVVDLRT
jgi:predicted nucleic acid-binding protein